MKRFLDTELFDRKQWFRKLPPTEKAAYIFLLTQCDAVGVWIPDKELAEFIIGSKVDWELLLKESNKNIEILNNGKWWFVDFCDFQYGELTPDCPPHRKYIYLLKKHGLLQRVSEGYQKGNERVVDTLQEKEEEKEEEKEKEKEKEETYAPGVKMKPSAYADMCRRFGKKVIDNYIERISDYQKSNRKRYGDIPATIKNWMRRDRGVESVKELEIRGSPVCPKCGKSLENEIRNGATHCYNAECDADIREVVKRE